MFHRACVTQSVWGYLIQHFGNQRFLAHLTWYTAHFIQSHRRIFVHFARKERVFPRAEYKICLPGIHNLSNWYCSLSVFYNATFIPGKSVTARMNPATGDENSSRLMFHTVDLFGYYADVFRTPGLFMWAALL
jgi:hypothetical protein